MRPRGSVLKTVVLSLLLAAAQQLVPNSHGTGLIQLVICLTTFVQKLSEEFIEISMRYEESRRDIVFQLQPKRAPDTPCERARLVLVNELDMDSWHGRCCVQTGCTVGIPEITMWLGRLMRGTWLDDEKPQVAGMAAECRTFTCPKGYIYFSQAPLEER